MMSLTTKIKLAVLALGVFSLVICGFYIKTLKADNQRLGQEAAAARAEAASLTKELKLNWQALEEREKQVAAIRQATDVLKNQLEALYEHDEEAKSWGGAYLPKSIIDKLR